MNRIIEEKIMFGDKEGIVRIGEYAHQANASVTLQCGETIVHAVITMGEEIEDLDFFPLSVEYNENLYAGGLIKSSKFIKREGKPSDEAILRCRLIDRSIRPMFPKEFNREVQLIVNVLSSDKKNPHDVLGLNAAIICAAISDIPFDSNIGGLRLSKINGDFIINPTYEECDKQDFELVLAGNDKKIIMIESAANCIDDDEILKGFEYSYKYLGEIASKVKEIEKKHGKQKVEFTPKSQPEELINKIKDFTVQKIDEYFTKFAQNKELPRKDFKNIIVDPVMGLFSEEEIEKYSKKAILAEIDKIFKKLIRANILNKKLRIDGRGLEEIREIQIRINPIPCVHGSAMFQRGETQVLNILTLGAPGNEQLLESLEGESKKRYIHHYNAPPYSVGEVGRFGAPGRREIGHGALAEKALVPVLPSQDVFPYVVRLVSEVMGQNGSSSMASTCASTISLMAGGVPIKEPVAGISIGLMTGENEDDFITITDIRGFEDFGGDMDFKIAGTYDTITAIQMDTKIKGLTINVIRQAIYQAKRARRIILDKIKEAIPEPNKQLSERAPKIESIQIPVESIGKVVGPSGKVIKQLISDYEVEINIEDNGMTTISGTNMDNIQTVKNIINGITNDPTIGDIFTGKVTRIMDFGAFVEIYPGKEGLVHISKMAKNHVKNVNDVVKIDDKVKVKLMNIDQQGRLNFSMILDDEDIEERPERRERRDNRRFIKTDKKRYD
jgi:polyribonucleotide nucleotidyltransferase